MLMQKDSINLSDRRQKKPSDPWGTCLYHTYIIMLKLTCGDEIYGTAEVSITSGFSSKGTQLFPI